MRRPRLMTMKICEVLSVNIIALFFSTTAMSGELLNNYNQDLQKLVSAQEKNPNKVIRFSDDAGSVAQAVLDITRVNSVLAELETETNQLKTLSALSNSMHDVATRYESAFAANGQQYEEEYLAAFKVSFAIVQKAVATTLRAIKLVKPTDDEMSKKIDAAARFAQMAPSLMITALTQMIDAGKLSQKGSVAAKEIVASFNQSARQQSR